MTAVAAAQQPPTSGIATDYQQLQQPTLTQSALAEEAVLHWGALQFTLHRGTIALAAALASPSGSRVMTAVFRGSGTLAVAPPDTPQGPIEAAQMRMFSGHAPLSENFSIAIFHFSDAAAFQAAFGSSLHFHPAAPNAALTAAARDRAHDIEQDGLRLDARALLALDRTPSRWLQADLDTDHHGWIEARYDPLDGEEVQVSRWVESTAYDDNVTDDEWTHFGDAGEPVPEPAPYTLSDYAIQLNIPGNLDIQSHASFTVTARTPTRGLLLTLDSNLRLTAASAAAGGAHPEAVEWLQPRDPGRTPEPLYQGNWLYLRLPQPLAAGASTRVTIDYHGKHVVTNVGAGNFFAQSEGWYPLVPFGPVEQRANFQLQFTLNHKYTLVATGEPTSDVRHGDTQTSSWHSAAPLTFAGFAFGDYKAYDQNLPLPGGQQVKLEVAVNNQPDDALQAFNVLSSMANPFTLPAFGTLSMKNQAPRALSQVGAALQLMTAFFGPYPYDRMTVTDIPGDYGQGWPGLLYLSSLSFLDSTQQHVLGLPANVLDQLSDTFRAHEVSHQWWGHKVGWASYHDQWLSEGFANFSGVLFQQAEDGPAAATTTLQHWKDQLEYKNRMGRLTVNDGPLWLGLRLESSQDAAGYRTIEYDKGGYVLWMLRAMMLDHDQKVPDARFIAMMQDFTSTYDNRDATTADFQKIAEKYMRPVMDLDGNHSLDWFFREYVYGTAIDKITFKDQVTPDAGGKTAHLQVTVDNPQGWEGLLPISVWQGKREARILLQVHGPRSSATIPLPFVPTKVEANQHADMLVDVDQ